MTNVIVCTPEDAFEYSERTIFGTTCECGAQDCTKVCEWCESPVCDACAGKQLGICMECVRGEWQTEEEIEQSIKDARDRHLDQMGL